MSDSQVLRNVSRHLRHLLLNGLSGDEAVGGGALSEESISLGSPVKLMENGSSPPAMSQALLSLYLYQITPNAHINNRPLIASGTGEQQYPPLSLNLFYLLTPLATSPSQDLLLLGRAMQVLAAIPIIQASFLASQLRPNPPEVRLILNPLNLEEMTRIWNAFNQPYHLSVCYQVQVISIDSIRLPETEAPVQERLLDVHQLVTAHGGGS